jgi:hypothetical protein
MMPGSEPCQRALERREPRCVGIAILGQRFAHAGRQRGVPVPDDLVAAASFIHSTQNSRRPSWKEMPRPQPFLRLADSGGAAYSSDAREVSFGDIASGIAERAEADPTYDGGD